ncbi:hypothetical protein [Dactylosporangium matsuzakiense]|uniref:Uncharacterized protein n=1 Tax=Dactylosporangium matsuzakiense TaxID=53360 RepID=A0A9W6NN92_9ACTN|nr:hypothetical protein [Dactylosporangium matsuzakiense]UWZ48698.1 hypothetical protein Dmats_21210 [Dactylosporangium matsuzakiense]GLL03071.1 hypothetical protein GCM10017581_048140 [Dactylosporangium matsuzakiense]
MSRLSGLWACIAGGAALVLLVLYLDPITDQRDCPNWGAAGNASAYGDERWDYGVLLLCMLWMAAVLIEQLLPPARRGRSQAGGAWRTVAAGVVTVLVSCCGLAPIGLTCH